LKETLCLALNIYIVTFIFLLNREIEKIEKIWIYEMRLPRFARKDKEKNSQ